jgi:hypothetical protein
MSLHFRRTVQPGLPDAHHHAAALPDLADDTQRRLGTAFIIAHDPVSKKVSGAALIPGEVKRLRG